MGKKYLTAGLLVLAISTLAGTSAWGGGPHHELPILFDQVVPPVPGPPMNVRWATDHSVYLARLKDGVAEVSLDSRLTPIRQVIPDATSLGGFTSFDRLAASNEYLAVASDILYVAWSPLRRPPDVQSPVTKISGGTVDDIDLFNNRLLLLGFPHPRLLPTSLAETRGIAWLASVSDRGLSTSFEPILDDAGGAGLPMMTKCGGFKLGGARFMPDGSFLVVPGVQPGIYLYSANARLLRTWDSAKLGLDSDCSGVSTDEWKGFKIDHRKRFSYINSHGVVDEILPFRQGPGLVIRTAADGQVRWTLKVLESGERVLTYDLPFTGKLPFDRLRGDLRGNKMVFLVSEHGFESTRASQPGRLVVVEAPGLQGGH